MEKIQVVGAAVLLLAGCTRGVEVTDAEVRIRTDDFDAVFARTGPLSDTYLLFGGGHFAEKNILAPIVLAALPLADAKAIHAAYPDFHRCASPGAEDAKARIVTLSVIASGSDVLDALRDALSRQDANLKSGGDRICIRVQGSTLELKSLRLRDSGEDLTGTAPPQTYVLITSVESVEAQAALASG